MKLPIITALALTLGLAPPALAARAFHTIPQPAGTYYDGSAGWGVSPSGEILGSFFTQPGGNEADQGPVRGRTLECADSCWA